MSKWEREREREMEKSSEARHERWRQHPISAEGALSPAPGLGGCCAVPNAELIQFCMCPAGSVHRNLPRGKSPFLPLHIITVVDSCGLANQVTHNLELRKWWTPKRSKLPPFICYATELFLCGMTILPQNWLSSQFHRDRRGIFRKEQFYQRQGIWAVRSLHRLS